MSRTPSPSALTHRLTRRRWLRALGAAGVASLAGATPVAADGRRKGARPILCEVDLTQSFDVEMHLDGDPAGGDRSWVVHATSRGDTTRDYDSGTVNVEDQDLAVGDAAADSRVTYDFYVGEGDENAAPDEVFLLIHTDDLADDELYAAFQTADADPETGTWLTRNVSAEMRGEGRGWREELVTRESVESGQAIIETAVNLRDSEETFSSVVERYGADASLVGVGFGAGFTTQETVVDLYVDDLVVAGRTYDFPAAVPVRTDVSVDGDRVVATLSFVQDERNVGLDAVVPDTVKLTEFVRAAPPVEDGVNPTDVQVSDGDLVVTFPTDAVKVLLGSGTAPAIVAGEFDVEEVVWFVGTGELSFDASSSDRTGVLPDRIESAAR